MDEITQILNAIDDGDVSAAGELLPRYRIRLRSGDYIVWADSPRRVIKLVPAEVPMAEVVLEGFEESARALRP